MKILSVKEFSIEYNIIESKVREMTKIKGFPSFQVGTKYHIIAEDAEIWMKNAIGKKFENEESKRRYIEDRKRRLEKKQ